MAGTDATLPFSTALVTGASSGIGRELSLILARAGVRVAVAARRELELEELAEEVEAGRVVVLPADLSRAEEARRIVTRTEELLGGLDLLIANAGVGGGGRRVIETSAERIRETILVNTLAPMMMIREALPAMIQRRRGYIAGISSLASFRGLPRSGAYSASKSALSTFLESVRVETRRYGITVTDIHPGYIRTPMTAGREANMPFLMDADRAARLILGAIIRRKAVYNFPWQMSLVLRFARLLPPFLYDRLIGGQD